MKQKYQFPPRWPFDVSKWPFFYGWVIWLFSTLGFLMSVPGQTMGMAVFTDPFITAFDLTRTQLSFAYLCGTVASSLLLTRAGRLYDRVGARTMIVGSSLALGLLVLFISVIDKIGGFVADFVNLKLASVTLPLILIGYFGVRFTGQGVLTSASRNVLLVWFERRRGFVSGIRGVLVSLGFSIAPLLLAFMIDSLGWRESLWLLAAVLVLVFAVIATVFLRDSPESVGLLVDGEKPVSGKDNTQTIARPAQTLTQAKRSASFWLYSCGLGIHALFGTAVVFHVVSIFSEAGRSRGEAFGYFLPQAIVATSVNLVASWLIDRQRLKPLLIIMLSSFLVGATGLVNLHTSWGYGLLVFGFGTGGGLWGVISNLAYIRLFGSLHLGEISGLNTSISVFASAIGPFLFSLGYDLTGSYQASEILCGLIIAGLLITTIIVKQPDDKIPVLQTH